ncbi:MAG: glutaredoxin [Myxococcales bacterium]|nr:glutaredoxin [Myxococcales bacterium]
MEEKKMRHVLDESRIHQAIAGRIANLNRDLIDEVEAAIAANDVVVVGMKHNPHPKRAGRALKDAGIAYKYLGYGTYTGQWRRRNALKMWSGWPTFPMVFVKGTLIGGADETLALIESGELSRMLG